MKYAALLLLFAGLSWAEDDAAPDPAKLLNDLTAANAAKDVGAITQLLKPITEVGKTSKEAGVVNGLAKELGGSFKVCKGNWGTLKKIAEALGELRSKSGAKALKKYAFLKKAKNEDEEGLQAAAVLAIGKMADPKLIDRIGDTCKSKSVHVAKAGYQAFQGYGTAKGKVRKKCAELLMKRIDMEFPSNAPGKSVSAEAQERWQQLSSVIVASMQVICREPTINDVPNWREWWKENKGRSKSWKDA